MSLLSPPQIYTKFLSLTFCISKIHTRTRKKERSRRHRDQIFEFQKDQCFTLSSKLFVIFFLINTEKSVNLGHQSVSNFFFFSARFDFNCSLLLDFRTLEVADWQIF